MIVVAVSIYLYYCLHFAYSLYQMSAEESNIVDDTDSDAKMEDLMEETRVDEEEEDDEVEEEEGDGGGGRGDMTECTSEAMALSSLCDPPPTTANTATPAPQYPPLLPHIPHPRYNSITLG